MNTCNSCEWISMQCFLQDWVHRHHLNQIVTRVNQHFILRSFQRLHAFVIFIHFLLIIFEIHYKSSQQYHLWGNFENPIHFLFQDNKDKWGISRAKMRHFEGKNPYQKSRLLLDFGSNCTWWSMQKRWHLIHFSKISYISHTIYIIDYPKSCPTLDFGLV